LIQWEDLKLKEDGVWRKTAWKDEVDGLPELVEQLETVKENADKIGNLTTSKADKSALETHLEDYMPHQFINHKENKTYKFGFQVSVDGKPQDYLRGGCIG